MSAADCRIESSQAECHRDVATEQLYPSLISLQAQEQPSATQSNSSALELWKTAIKETVNSSTGTGPSAGACIGFGTGVFAYLTMSSVDHGKANNLMPFLALVAATTVGGHLAGNWLPLALVTFGGIGVIARLTDRQ